MSDRAAIIRLAVLAAVVERLPGLALAFGPRRCLITTLRAFRSDMGVAQYLACTVRRHFVRISARAEA
jgi:hypothetical protein